MADQEPVQDSADQPAPQGEQLDDLDVLPEDADKVKAGQIVRSADPQEGGQ